MKVLIIGATGNVGRHTVDAALDAGHEVTAFGRTTEKIERDDAKLSVVRGDVLEPDEVAASASGQDALILTFGAPLNRDSLLHKPTLCEEGTRNAIAAMRTHGVPRLIAMTSIGAGDSHGHGRFVFRNIIEPVMLGRIMQDREAQEALVRDSNLPSWAIVRPTELDDGAPGEVRVITDIENEPEPTTISRVDVARTLVAMLDDHAHDGRSVVITN